MNISGYVLFTILTFLTGTQGPLSLSLQEAKRIALENNRDIQIVRKSLDISRGDIKAQKGIFDPIFNLNLSFTDAQEPTASTFIPSGSISIKEFNTQSGISGTLPTGTFYNLFNFSITRTTTDSPIETLSPNWTTNLSFTIGQELLRNFGLDVNLTPITVAKISSDISQKELEAVISNILLNVETAYWTAVAAKQELENQRAGLELAKDLRRRNEIQVEVGVLPPVAITQAKSEVAAREVDVINAENALRAAEDRLKNLLALPLTQQIILTDTPTEVIRSFNESNVLKEALEKRPEIAQANLDIKGKETLKKFFSNQRLPSLSVQGTLNLKGLGGKENPNRIVFGDLPPQPISEKFNDSFRDSFRNLFEAEFPTWQVLGVFSFPIFNWTARGNYIKASAELDRSVITYKKVVDDVTLEVRNAIREIENSIQRIEAAKSSIELAEEVLRNEEERLKVGVGTTRDVIEAQRDLINARTQLINAIASYNIALAQLEYARGTIMEESKVEIE
ncbi:MAG: transporter [Deltaproteobacteria bacterium]|jgi:outer membrane protein TolC|nr:MAG: transporter [Deltaproteobacteria bacterium]